MQFSEKCAGFCLECGEVASAEVNNELALEYGGTFSTVTLDCLSCGHHSQDAALIPDPVYA